MCKQMSSDSFKNVIYKQFIYNIYIYIFFDQFFSSTPGFFDVHYPMFNFFCINLIVTTIIL